ncbi:MAG TPA: biopolymer transporter ExbD [Thermoanaerobaculia bacterium]|jgi:biopolymer transport protein TolR
MIERSLQIYGIALFGVVLTLFMALIPPQPIACGFVPRVSLPWATTATRVHGAETDLEITIRKTGEIFVGQNRVPAAQLAAELRTLADRGTDRQLLVSADGTVSYGDVEQVLAAARDAGFRRLALMTFRGTAVEAWERGGTV